MNVMPPKLMRHAISGSAQAKMRIDTMFEE
jgi:hypothetical protein